MLRLLLLLLRLLLLLLMLLQKCLIREYKAQGAQLPALGYPSALLSPR
jgi:hypothetical protein